MKLIEHALVAWGHTFPYRFVVYFINGPWMFLK